MNTVDKNDTHQPMLLFLTDFCHPAQVTKDAPWGTCVNMATATDCSNIAGCNWSNGKELIPDGDFCAPMDLTSDVQLIEQCLSSDTDATCVAGCAWRHGKNNTVPKNTTGPAPLFSKEFCHPVNVTKDTKDSVW